MMLLALATTAGLALGVGALPASASTPICTGLVQNVSFNVLNFGGVAAVHRGACIQVNVVYITGQDYWFSVGAQDWDESPLQSSYTSDDAGIVQIQFRTPGSSVWHDWTYDTNSADYNEAYGSSAVYNDVINGPATAWTWRARITTHYRCTSVALCGNNTGWITTQAFSGPFTV